MRGKLLLGGLVVLVLMGAYWLYLKPSQDAISSSNSSTGLIRNAEILDTGTQDLIKVNDNVAYFPNSRGYLAQPTPEGSYPGIIMIHENRGLRPEIKLMADTLAQEGYVVLAVDLFKGAVVESQDEAKALTQEFDQTLGTQNLMAAYDYLKNQGATKIASLGWCFGGKQALELALSGKTLDATIVYYGSGMPTTTVELSPLSGPVLGIFGEQDHVLPIDKVKEFETSINTLEIENEIYVYPGVGHAFANPSGVNYAPEETADAWSKTISFLIKHLKS